MKICHVITRLIIGGAQENTVLTCRGLTEHGHDVTLVSGPETGPEGSLWDTARQAGCDLVKLDTLRRAISPVRDLRAWLDLRRLFRRLEPEIVHTHSSKAGILARSAAASAGVPIIVHTIHGMSFNRAQSTFAQRLFCRLERRAARYTSAIVTVADAMIDQSVAARVAPRERFTTIRSGIELERFAPRPELRASLRPEWGVGDGDVVVGTIARLFDNKGYEEIIEAMPEALAQQPRLRFAWVGDGARRTQYEQRLTELGLRDRVRFVGLVRPDEVAGLVNAFDVVLHASRWEGLPRALVQGLLTEVPAVSFDNDGAPEVVIDGETGILVPYGDVAGLTHAIIKLAGDPELRSKLGRAGRARCTAMFDWQKMVSDIESLYKRLSRERLSAAIPAQGGR